MGISDSGTERPCTVEGILFDFGGVLAEEGFRNGLMAIARQNRLDPESVYRKGSDLVYETGYVTGRAREGDFWQALKRETGVDGDEASLRRVILDHFVLREWMIEIVRRLRSAHVSLAILSDQTNWLDELNAKYDFFRRFDRVFNSYHVGKSKKGDPTIFDDALNRLNVEPRQALFVDDTPGNVERAEKRGLNAVLYEGKEAFLARLKTYCPFL
jgi:HAD superfamily hydrolase (TIGR01509 family)